MFSTINTCTPMHQRPSVVTWSYIEFNNLVWNIHTHTHTKKPCLRLKIVKLWVSLNSPKVWKYHIQHQVHVWNNQGSSHPPTPNLKGKNLASLSFWTLSHLTCYLPPWQASEKIPKKGLLPTSTNPKWRVELLVHMQP